MTVTVKEIIADTLQQTFVTGSQQGSGPDIVVGAHDWIGNLVQNGSIDPVNLTAAQKSSFEAAALKAVTFNGQVYGAPYAMENLALIRNTELAPTAPATIEDLVKAGQDLKAAGKVSEIMCLQVGAERRRLPHLPAVRLRRRLAVRRHLLRRPGPEERRGGLGRLGQGLHQAQGPGREGRRRAEDARSAARTPSPPSPARSARS